MGLFFTNTYRVSQRAAAIVNYCAQKYPILIAPYLEQMIDNLSNVNLHDAVKRNTVRILQFIDIPEKLMGKTANVCFDFLKSGTEPIAVKCFSMSVLYNISKKNPGLNNELKLVIEAQMPYGSAGYKSRAKRILKEL